MLMRISTPQPWLRERLGGIGGPPNIDQLCSDADPAAVGLARPVPFAVPAGQATVGEATDVLDLDGMKVRQVYQIPVGSGGPYTTRSYLEFEPAVHFVGAGPLSSRPALAR